MMGAREQFRDTIARAGLVPPGNIEPGAIHRFPGVGKSNGNTAGWCKLFDDQRGGVFGDFASGFAEHWQATHDGPAPTAEQRAAFRRQVEAARAEAAAKREAEHAEAAERARRIWEAAKPAPADHPYLAKKGIGAHGLRLADDGRLTVPLRAGGELRSLQFIGADCGKRFLPGGRIAGCYASIGEAEGAAVLCIAEGYATGASIHEATGYPVACAMNCGNLEPVARALRAKFPDLRIVICADDDARTQGNPGLTNATDAAHAVGGIVAVPDFGNDRPEDVTDFNDLHKVRGLDAVRQRIAKALEAPQAGAGAINYAFLDFDRSRLPATLFAHRPPPFPHIIERILPQAPGILVAPGSTGKTRLLLWEAAHIALGRPFLGFPVQEGRVLFITSEDEKAIFEARLFNLAETMGLTANQKKILIDRLLILDVTGLRARLVESDMAHNLIQTGIVDELIKRYADRDIRLVNLDPVSNLGPGEVHGNDGASMFLSACWRLSKGLGCAVRGVHHVAKAVVRDATLDQHAGRGGSAFADNSRYVWQLSMAEANKRPSEVDEAIAAGKRVLRLDVHKTSYAAPVRDPYYLIDTGTAFEQIAVSHVKEDTLARDFDRLCGIIRSEAAQNRRHARNGLEQLPSEVTRGLSRSRIRELVAFGFGSNRLVELDLSKAECHGGKKSYIAVRNLAVPLGEVGCLESAENDVATSPPTTSPPIRDGEVARLNSSPPHHPAGDFAKTDGEVTAKWRGSEPDGQDALHDAEPGDRADVATDIPAGDPFEEF